MTEDTACVCRTGTEGNAVSSEICILNLYVTVVYAVVSLCGVSSSVESYTGNKTACDTNVTLHVDVAVVYAVHENSAVDDAAEAACTHLFVCGGVNVDVTVVYGVNENAGNFVLLTVSNKACCPLSITGDGNVSVVLAVDYVQTLCGENGESSCVSVLEEDLALDLKVSNFAGEVSKHRSGYGYGVAVTIENTPEGLDVSTRKGDVGIKVVLRGDFSRVSGSRYHCQEFVCSVDSGSFGSSGSGDSKAANREDHHNTEDDGECLAHDIYLFHLIFSYR